MADSPVMAELRAFDSREDAAVALADHVAAAIGTAVADRGSATLIASGGNSPQAMFRTLRQKRLPWHKVTIVPSDERLVPVDHADSNEGMIRRELLQDEAMAAQLLSLSGAGLADDMGLSTLNVILDDLAKPLDIAILGLGDDGHTASLFPDSPDIDNALCSSDPCILQRPTRLATARLSMTPAFLLASNEIILLFFGLDKRAVYDRAIVGDNLTELPVRFVLHQQDTPVIAFWSS